MFSDQDAIIHHLFISCPIAKIVWRSVYMAFNIVPPQNISNMFGNWLMGEGGCEKYIELKSELVVVLYFGHMEYLGSLYFGQCKI
jgi:hypothetical protein